ncbi:uncharacterized protein LOC143019473 [Oratosquilla oratoria]|uniref:uncharacterized protein LOC143019473 n=1 Tax=Oratosquilla oratoria TaxID=337810 RepID=UPI003F76305E
MALVSSVTSAFDSAFSELRTTVSSIDSAFSELRTTVSSIDFNSPLGLLIMTLGIVLLIEVFLVFILNSSIINVATLGRSIESPGGVATLASIVHEVYERRDVLGLAPFENSLDAMQQILSHVASAAFKYE